MAQQGIVQDDFAAEELAAHAQEARQRSVERVLQMVLFAVIVGGWEMSARTGLADPFFFGQPSAIVATIWRWSTRGTPQGPLWWRRSRKTAASAPFSITM